MSRRIISQLVKERQALRLEGAQTFRWMLAVLAQAGPITVTKGTLEQVQEGLPYLTYKAAQSAVEGEMTVELVDTRPPQEEPPEVQGSGTDNHTSLIIS